MNTTTKTTSNLPKINLPDAMRWAGRITSLFSIAVLLMFLFGGNEGLPSGHEWLGLALFPGCVVLGFVVAWWKELIGGAASIGGLMAFYVWFLATGGVLSAGGYFALFTLPAVFFLISGGLRYRDGNKIEPKT